MEREMLLNTGRYLRINLSDSEINTGEVDAAIASDFIGGRGYGIRYLYEELGHDVDPLGEDNKLILLSGPLSGTSALGVSRWMAVTKSPLTGAFARSVGGADFGAWLKFAGYEFIIIEGKAEKPVYIHLTADSCRIHDAGELWGKSTRETQQSLSQTYGKSTRCACIGPAGEKLVKYAGIFSDRRSAGRCGTGAVMGSKNLKAIAINARHNFNLNDPDAYSALSREQIDIILNNKGYQNHKEWGTTGTQDHTNRIGIYPTKNFRYGQLTGRENITAEKYRQLRTGDMGCYSCPARCGKVHTVTSGIYRNAHSEGPEYESIWAFTGTIESPNIEASIAADQLCDDFGLDTISTGNTIGFAYELYEKGIITGKDTDGLELTWSNHEAMVALINKIANREGIGNILAEGTRGAAKIIGKDAEDYAIQVKGLELPAYEPRGAKSMGYNYATASIGASHCYGYAAQDIFGAIEPRPTNRFEEVENADVVIYNQDDTAWKETGIICLFAAGWGWVPDLYGKMLTAVRGIQEYSDNSHLRRAGERIFNLERLFNIRQGLGRQDDTLPKRMLTEPLRTGDAEGEGEIVRHQDEFLDHYYELRGWSREGVPSEEKLASLNLDGL
jgi:aldehyde:ferredoxin oxidoreductase